MFEEDVLPRVRERAGSRAPAPAHPQDRLHVRERRRPDPGPPLPHLHQPAHHHPLGPGPGGAAPDRRRGERGRGEARLEELAAGMRALLPGRFFTEDDRELPEVVAALLRERSLRLALAESCTGGLLGARLTEVAGGQPFPGAGLRDVLRTAPRSRSWGWRRRSSSATARSRRRSRRRWPRVRGGWRGSRSGWASRGSRDPTEGRRRSRSVSCSWPGRSGGNAGAPGALSRQPRAHPLPGHPGRAGDAAPGPARPGAALARITHEAA